LTATFGREAGGVFTLGGVIPSSYALKDSSATRIDSAPLFNAFLGLRDRGRTISDGRCGFLRFHLDSVVY
jgi:hypothetical protein